MQNVCNKKEKDLQKSKEKNEESIDNSSAVNGSRSRKRRGLMVHKYENVGVILKRALSTPLIGTKCSLTFILNWGVGGERLKGKENVIMDYIW